MKSKSFIRTTCLLMAGITAAVSLLAAPRPNSAVSAASDPWNDMSFREEASALLRQVQSSATQLSRDAATLHPYARSVLTRESHGIRLNLVRGHVNAMGKHLTRLQAIRHVAAPWQQRAIDSVVPMAGSVARETQAAIQYLNDGGKPLWAPDYVHRLREISDRSDQVKHTIDLHLEMAEAQEKLERLRDRADSLGS